MKRIFGILVALLTVVASNAQRNDNTMIQDYEKGWNEVDKLVTGRSFSSAYAKAESLYHQALSDKNSRQMLLGAWYLDAVGSQFRDDGIDSQLVRYNAVMPMLEPTDKALCNLFVAKCYAHYFMSNRWNIGTREEVDASETSYEHWGTRRFRQEVSQLVDAALEDIPLLQRTDIGDVSRFCSKYGDKGLLTTPTLYDLVTHEAADVLRIVDEDDKAVALARQRIDFHRANNPCLSVLLEAEQSDHSNEDECRVLIDRYRDVDCEVVAMLYYRYACALRSEQRYVEAVAVCDSAIARYPKSEGGCLCYNEKQSILSPSVAVNMEGAALIDRDALAVVEYRNVQTLYYRIVKYDEFRGNSTAKYIDHYSKLKPLKTWRQDLPVFDDHKVHKVYAYLPPMPAGQYMLLISPSADFVGQGLVARPYNCLSPSIVTVQGRIDDPIQGYVVDIATGHGLERVKVSLTHHEWKSDRDIVDATTLTESNGYFRFPTEVKKSRDRNYRLKVTVDGQTVSVASQNAGHAEEGTVRRHFATDRPIYKPGETVSFVYMSYINDSLRRSRSEQGDHKAFFDQLEPVEILLRDHNNKVVEKLTLRCDEFGSCHGEFHIPDNALPGRYTVYASNETSYENGVWFVNVEAYKQPKFMVTLLPGNVVHHFGEKVDVKGVAASYTSVPLGNAQVRYTVERSRVTNWRRWWEPATKEQVAQGMAVCNELGEFCFDFIPQPAEADTVGGARPQYHFEVSVDVTDINGESHSQSQHLNIGFDNSYLALDIPGEVSSLEQLVYRYNNLDGNPLSGEVTVEVERLRQPVNPKLDFGYADVDVRHTLDETAFVSRYPLTAYSTTENSIEGWPVEQVVMRQVCQAGAEDGNVVKMPSLASGVYRIRLSVVDAYSGQRVSCSQVVTLVHSDAKKAQTTQLLWSAVDKVKAEVGEVVTLRLGTRFDKVHVYYAMNVDGRLFRQGTVCISDEIRNIPIEVTKELLGNFTITLVAVKENVWSKKTYEVEVPYTHKRIDMRLSTFRDKLTPGSLESWSLSLSNTVGVADSVLEANCVMTMYDAALDTYGQLDWNWNFWLNNSSWFGLDFSKIVKYSRSYIKELERMQEEPSFATYGWTLKDMWAMYSCIPEVMCTNSFMKGAKVVATVGGVGYSDGVRVATGEDEVFEEEVFAVVEDDAALTAVAITETSSAESRNEVALRSNLNTLAFFQPTLRTNAQGEVSFDFKVPDLLTKWHIQGMAWTKDLKFGSLVAEALTYKEIMVVPNVPRFLRHGDEVDFVVKVSNTTDEVQVARVDLEFLDGDGNPIVGMVEEGHREVTLAAHAGKSVSFRLHVPDGIFAATYRVVACTDKHSDGEQGAVAVLPNRMLMTESMAMYINGRGSKRYTMEHLAHNASSTLQHRQLAVEFTANPIWYAVQSLPYVAAQENPSNLYRFHSYYTNSLAKAVVQMLGNKGFADEMDTLSANAVSRLEMNEDIKQTLLEETPWLREADSETERARMLKQYFSADRINTQIDDDLKKLGEAQRGDGGWSWIPGGRSSSVYITEYILKGFGRLMKETQSLGLKGGANSGRMLRKALNYVDNEIYKDYVKWMKNNKLGWRPDNVDYLYMRSFYADESFAGKSRESYDFYYANAVKHHGDYRSLYSRAQLALVFNRHGDSKLARNMVRQLKESALRSDEMGMYWRDNVSGFCWHERPIEVQSLLIEAFAEVTPEDKESVALMQQWLLKQKQTTCWNSDVSTAHAVSALMKYGSPISSQPDALTVRVGEEQIPSGNMPSGYTTRCWKAQEVSADKAAVTIEKTTDGIAWGALYWQYFEDMDKIPYNEMGVKLERRYYKVEGNDSLTRIDNVDGAVLKVGDRVRVRIMIDCDRSLEYLELKDGRASGFEPVSTASGWVWNDGLNYYMSVGNASTTFFVDQMDKGRYMAEYEVWLNNSGIFTIAPATMQCLYAPEFRSNTQGFKLVVEP